MILSHTFTFYTISNLNYIMLHFSKIIPKCLIYFRVNIKNKSRSLKDIIKYVLNLLRYGFPSASNSETTRRRDLYVQTLLRKRTY